MFPAAVHVTIPIEPYTSSVQELQAMFLVSLFLVPSTNVFLRLVLLSLFHVWFICSS